METMNKICTGMESKLADLLFDPEAVPARVKTHVAECENCQRELNELAATMSLLDEWKDPAPSPYFMTRMNARLDEVRESAPASWFERLRSRFVYGSPANTRPLAAMALTALMLVGGGAYLGVSDWDGTREPVGPTAVVHDLQTLDSNAQLLDELEALSTTNDNGE